MLARAALPAPDRNLERDRERHTDTQPRASLHTSPHSTGKPGGGKRPCPGAGHLEEEEGKGGGVGKKAGKKQEQVE